MTTKEEEIYKKMLEIVNNMESGNASDAACKFVADQAMDCLKIPLREDLEGYSYNQLAIASFKAHEFYSEAKINIGGDERRRATYHNYSVLFKELTRYLEMKAFN